MLSCIKHTSDWYVLNLPLIKRTFDSIYIHYNDVSTSLWNAVKDLAFRDTIIGISQCAGSYLIYILDLDSLSEQEYVTSHYEIVTYSLAWRKESIFYIWESRKPIILSSIRSPDFAVDCEDNKIIVTNIQLSSVVFEKEILPAPLGKEKEIEKSNNTLLYTPIIDVHFFENFLIHTKTEISFPLEITGFRFTAKEMNSDIWNHWMLSVEEKWWVKKPLNFYERLILRKQTSKYTKLEPLKKFLLFKNSHTFLLQSIGYRNLDALLQTFPKFEKSQDLSLAKNIIIPRKINIAKYDEHLGTIQKQLCHFIFHYQVLEENSHNISNLKSDHENHEIIMQSKRIQKLQQDMHNIKQIYKKQFTHYLSKIIQK